MIGAIAIFGEHPTPFAIAARSRSWRALRLSGDPRALLRMGADRGRVCARDRGGDRALPLWDKRRSRSSSSPRSYTTGPVVGQRSWSPRSLCAG